LTTRNKRYISRNMNCVPKVVKMRLKGDAFWSVGNLLMAVGILIGRFARFEYAGFVISAFIEGLLAGVSLVMNLFYLATKARKRQV